MRTTLVGLVVAAAALVMVGATGAHAYPVYPWCANLPRGATNCGFCSFAQCRAYVSGIGGFCSQNSFYGAAGTPARQCGGRRR